MRRRLQTRLIDALRTGLGHHGWPVAACFWPFLWGARWLAWS